MVQYTPIRTPHLYAIHTHSPPLDAIHIHSHMRMLQYTPFARPTFMKYTPTLPPFMQYTPILPPVCNTHPFYTQTHAKDSYTSAFTLLQVVDVCDTRDALTYMLSFIPLTPRAEETGLKIITTAKISHKFSRESP